MNTLNLILEEINIKGITEKKFLSDLGLHKSALSDWKCGKNKSYRRHIDKIAKYLEVSVDYLLGRTTEKNSTQFSAELEELIGNDEELRNIIVRLSNLSDDDLRLASDLIEKLAEKSS